VRARRRNDVTGCNGFDMCAYGSLCADMTSSIKPEVTSLHALAPSGDPHHSARGIRNVPLPLNGVNNFETDQSCCVNLRRELNRQVTKFIIVHLHVNRICERRVINCIHSFIHSFILSVGVSGTTFVDKNDNTNELIN